MIAMYMRLCCISGWTLASQGATPAALKCRPHVNLARSLREVFHFYMRAGAAECTPRPLAPETNLAESCSTHTLQGPSSVVPGMSTMLPPLPPGTPAALAALVTACTQPFPEARPRMAAVVALLDVVSAHLVQRTSDGQHMGVGEPNTAGASRSTGDPVTGEIGSKLQTQGVQRVGQEAVPNTDAVQGVQAQVSYSTCGEASHHYGSLPEPSQEPLGCMQVVGTFWVAAAKQTIQFTQSHQGLQQRGPVL